MSVKNANYVHTLSLLSLGSYTDSDAERSGPEILLDPGELLHPGHPGGDVGVLADHPRLHQPHLAQNRLYVQCTCVQTHQVHDGVQGEVSVGRDVSAEEALIT